MHPKDPSCARARGSDRNTSRRRWREATGVPVPRTPHMPSPDADLEADIGLLTHSPILGPLGHHVEFRDGDVHQGNWGAARARRLSEREALRGSYRVGLPFLGDGCVWCGRARWALARSSLARTRDSQIHSRKGEGACTARRPHAAWPSCPSWALAPWLAYHGDPLSSTKTSQVTHTFISRSLPWQ